MLRVLVHVDDVGKSFTGYAASSDRVSATRLQGKLQQGAHRCHGKIGVPHGG